MTKFIGRLADIGIAKEAVRGTAETSAAFYLPKLSLSIDDGVEQVEDESSIGIIEDSTGSSVTGKFAEGEIEGHIHDKSFGLLLLAALGTVNTSGPAETSVYTHTFTMLQSAQHPSLTLFVDDPNQDYKYALGMLQSLNIDIAVGQFAKYTAGFRSKVGATATLSPSYSAENKFLPQHATLKIATDLSSLGAASVINVRSVKIEKAKNVEDERTIGSLDQVDILNKQASITGQIEITFDAATFKTEMLADTAKAMRLRLTNSDVTIGSTLHPQITIDFAKVKFSNFKRGYSNNEIATATVDFKAFYSIADTKMITVELINTQASY
jgi:hypothetical protein